MEHTVYFEGGIISLGIDVAQQVVENTEPGGDIKYEDIGYSAYQGCDLTSDGDYEVTIYKLDDTAISDLPKYFIQATLGGYHLFNVYCSDDADLHRAMSIFRGFA